ncbi:MAG: CDC48 family AAA ATPase [Candidatus Pacearchaeota archaeon]|nr:CDC48 family AAA ATPase [Candidatus Pacearchaeota archaeon]
MPEQPDHIKLKVLEALQDDAYKGVARIDTEVMRALGLQRGDIISIKGEKETVAIIDRSYPADIGEGIIRIDGLTRKNAKTGIGEKVTIRKASIKPAKKITIAPAQPGVMVQGDPEAFRSGLLGRALMKGDLVSLGGVQRRRDLMHDTDDIFGDLQDLFGHGFGGFSGFQNIRFKIISVSPNQPVIITEDTEVSVSAKAINVSEETIPEVTYEDIGGLTDEVKKIREMVELPLKHPEIFDRLGIDPPKGVLLHGAPGTGKTLLAKAVANESEANFILLNGPECMSKFYGESEKKIRDIFEEAEKNAPTIIFIDEIDAIAPKREEVQGEVERRVVSQLLTMMDGLNSRGRVVVIGATNRVNSIDPALRRPGRFDREMEISIPDKKGRLNILKIHTRGMPLKKNVDLEFLAAKTHGFVGADLESLAKEAAMNLLRKLLPEMKLEEDEEIPQMVLDKIIIGKEDFEEALKVVRPSAMREVLVETPNIGWDDIGGLDKIKQELKEAVEWPIKHRPSFERLGITPPKGVLLYGPPGTGKTLLAKAVAKESEANFIQVKGPSLLSMWVGKSEEGVRKIFERARQVSPCIIFFDEIDSLAGKRGIEQGTKVTERVLNQLLSEMDGIEDLKNVVVIGATNRPDMLDSALLRPGRFDRILLVDVPDDKSREKIFEIHTKKTPISLTKAEREEIINFIGKDSKLNAISKTSPNKPTKQKEANNSKEEKTNIKDLSDKDALIHYLVKKTEGFVGADIENLIREAALIALRKDMETKTITAKDFEEALAKTSPSVSENTASRYKKIEEHYLKQAKAGLASSPVYAS